MKTYVRIMRQRKWQLKRRIMRQRKWRLKKWIMRQRKWRLKRRIVHFFEIMNTKQPLQDIPESVSKMRYRKTYFSKKNILCYYLVIVLSNIKHRVLNLKLDLSISFWLDYFVTKFWSFLWDMLGRLDQGCNVGYSWCAPMYISLEHIKRNQPKIRKMPSSRIDR